MQHVTVPRATWDAMLEALERIAQNKFNAQFIAENALTAANAVSHTNPETAPVTEGGAITSESNAVQPQAQGEAAKKYAENLCISMARKFYPEVTQFEPLDDLFGLLTQIDNMTTGLVRPQTTEPAPQEWISVDDQMPPTMERVLAIEPRHRIVKVDMWFGPDFQWSYTHWMPLPAAPEAKQ